MLSKIEYTDRKQIEQCSLSKIQTALAYLNAHSPFYKNLFKEAKINIQAIKKLEDIHKIPTTSKDDLAKFNDDFLCVSPAEIAEWTTTSGTLGNPVSFGLTKNDLNRLALNEARSLEITDCKSSDKIQLMVTLDKRFMAGLAYYLGAQLFGCATIRVGSGSPGLQIDSIRRFNPNILISVPSFLLKVLEYASKQKTDLSDAGIEKIICIGEPIRNVDFSLNNLGKRLSEKLPNTKLFSTYASTEMSTAITECVSSCGGHIPTELIYIEILDDDGFPVESGKPGEVSITTFGIEGMPLLRYRTGDVCILETTSCNCGNKTHRLTPVIGRKKQMIKYKGTTLFPEAIYELMNGIKEVNDYVLLLENNDIDTDELSVLVNIKPEIEKEEAKQLLNETFQTHLRVKPMLIFKDSSEIRAIKHPSSARKPLKIIDRRMI